MKEIRIQAKILKRFIRAVLRKVGAVNDVAEAVSTGLVQTSLRGVDSHGVRLLSHYVAACEKGRINPKPKYKFKQTSFSTAILDADHTFGHAAGIFAAHKAVGLAREAGTGHVAVYNSTHFGAAAYYALEIAKHDMIGMSFTHADALIKTYNGKKAFLGTNPIAFAAPCFGEEPFCLDMATSVITFNKVKQLKAEKKSAPKGTGADKYGRETTDPDKIAMLMPIGGYKGYGLSMMVEILCSMLTGMPYGPHISRMFAAPLYEKRFLGHFVIAMRIDCFQNKKVFKKRMSALMRELRKEPRRFPNVPVQVAGDPEKANATVRSIKGIPFTPEEFKTFQEISKKYGVMF